MTSGLRRIQVTHTLVRDELRIQRDSARTSLVVAYTELEDKTIWLIAARKAEAKYQRQYEKENA